MRKNLLKLFILVLPAVIIYFLFRDIYRNWNEIKSYAVNINYAWLFVSYAGFIVANIFMTGIWYVLLRKMRAPIGLGASIAIWSVSILGKYIPGKGWQFVSIVYIARKLGVSYTKSVTASVMGQILAIIAGLIAGFSILKPYLPPVVMAVFLAGSLIFIYPDFLNRLLKILGKITGKDIVEIDLGMRDTLTVTFLYLLGWLVFGLSFNILIMSIFPDWGFKVFYSTKIFVSSYLMGLFAVFVPGGLGVREGVMAFLLGKSLPAYLASFISVLARLVATISELTLTVYGIYFLKKSGFEVFRKSE